MSEEGRKIRRSNKANPKERFSGFLDKVNLDWARKMAEKDDRSVASMINKVLRQARQAEPMEIDMPVQYTKLASISDHK